MIRTRKIKLQCKKHSDAKECFGPEKVFRAAQFNKELNLDKNKFIRDRNFNLDR